MTDKAISPLRRRLIDDMAAKIGAKRHLISVESGR